MKFVRRISLYILYPVMFLGIGFLAGVETAHFFYPYAEEKQENIAEPEPETIVEAESLEDCLDAAEIWDSERTDSMEAESEIERQETIQQAAATAQTLTVDTEYVLEETNILDQSVVETSWRLPHKYVGMNRRQFLEAMAEYEAAPPLSELERGFVNLEVLSFSREKVVVQMNYRYVQPSASFYLAVYDNKLIVYLEDRETVYMETEIALEALPEELQQQVMQMLWIADEESLYYFLENYSS